MKKPRLFVSYSHYPPEKKELALAFLRSLQENPALEVHGDVDVESPQGPPSGWTPWMREQIERADWVLVVCSEVYRQAWEKKVAEGSRGVTYEAALLLQELYEAGMVNRRLIPVILEEGDMKAVPRELRDFTRYQVPEEQDLLVSRILKGTWLGRFVEGLARAEGSEGLEEVTPSGIFEGSAELSAPSELPALGKLRGSLIQCANAFIEQVAEGLTGLELEKARVAFRKAFCPRAKELLELTGELPEVLRAVYEKECIR